MSWLRMGGVKYREILGKTLVKSAKCLKMGQKFIFQQHRDPKHKVKATMEWFARNKVDVLE